MIQNLENSRFENLKQITDRLKEFGAENPHVFHSESERLEDQDFILDGTLKKESDEDFNYFTLYYIKDNAGNYYITESNFWANK